MAKNPKAHKAVGFRGAKGQAYADRSDDRIVGMGNPPSDPEWQRENPGAGRMPMDRQLVDVEELEPGRRPAEERWVLKPAGERTGVPIELGEEPPAEPPAE